MTLEELPEVAGTPEFPHRKLPVPPEPETLLQEYLSGEHAHLPAHRRELLSGSRRTTPEEFRFRSYEQTPTLGLPGSRPRPTRHRDLNEPGTTALRPRHTPVTPTGETSRQPVFTARRLRPYEDPSVSHRSDTHLRLGPDP